jgi:hypothetical protein
MLIMQVTWETDVLLPERCSPYTTVRFRGSADVKAASPLSTTESEFISAAEALINGHMQMFVRLTDLFIV